MKITKHPSKELQEELDRRANEPIYEVTKKFVFFLEGEPVVITEATAKQFEDRIEVVARNFPKTQRIDGVVVNGRLVTATYPSTVSKGFELTFDTDWPVL